MNARNVLIVDDEPMILMLVEDALVDAGYAVISAADGDEAMCRLDAADQNFAAVITDIRMPSGIHGWDVGRRAREVSSDIAVIYMSGDAGAQWPVLGVSQSIFIQKPFAAAQAVTELSKLLTRP